MSKLRKTKPVEKFLTDEFIDEFAKTNGGHQVHSSWRDNMLSQGREVSSKRLQWDTLNSEDRVLDALIAYDVIKDYVSYILTHSKAHQLDKGE